MVYAPLHNIANEMATSFNSSGNALEPFLRHYLHQNSLNRLLVQEEIVTGYDVDEDDDTVTLYVEFRTPNSNADFSDVSEHDIKDFVDFNSIVDENNNVLHIADRDDVYYGKAKLIDSTSKYMGEHPNDPMVFCVDFELTFKIDFE